MWECSDRAGGEATSLRLFKARIFLMSRTINMGAELDQCLVTFNQASYRLSLSGVSNDCVELIHVWMTMATYAIGTHFE